jgi:ribosomal protein L7Ae-like RNA K-turn-binding protein
MPRPSRKPTAVMMPVSPGRTDVDAATQRKVLGLIGLGVRARNAVVGVEQVRVAARRGQLMLAVVAPDASENSRRKVIPLLAARGVRMIEGPSAEALGSVVGRDTTTAIGITDAALARGLRAAAADGTGHPRSGAVASGR